MVKDREAWLAAVHGVTKNRIRFSDWIATTRTKGDDSNRYSRTNLKQEKKHFPAFSSVLLFRTQQRLLRVGWNDKNHPPAHHQKAFKWLDVFYWIKEIAKISSFPSGLTVDLSYLLSTEDSTVVHLCCLPIKDGPRWPLEGCRALDSTPLGGRQQPN